MTERHLTFAAALASVLVLTACGNSGNSDDTAGSGGSNGHGGGHSSSGTAEASGADIEFLQGMTPHHEQAVEMSEIVLAADPPAEVAAIATQIKDAQDPEIQQMTEMLETLGASTGSGEHGGGHSAAHGGMMSEADMAELRSASGVDAARLYLEGMIEHHEGAIEASDAEIANGEYGPAIELAKEIKQAQAAEITTMEQLLDRL